MIIKSFNRPKGGGPCPLIRNPVTKWLKLLAICHLILLLISCVTTGYPFIYDLHCSVLYNSLANIIASSISSALMATYYFIISTRDLGTEVEWAITAMITTSVVVIDFVIAGWGFYACSNASIKIYQALNNRLTLEQDCLQTKAAVFFFAAFAVIFAHVVVAGFCGIVSWILTKGLKRQLMEMRNLA